MTSALLRLHCFSCPIYFPPTLSASYLEIRKSVARDSAHTIYVLTFKGHRKETSNDERKGRQPNGSRTPGKQSIPGKKKCHAKSSKRNANAWTPLPTLNKRGGPGKCRRAYDSGLMLPLSRNHENGSFWPMKRPMEMKKTERDDSGMPPFWRPR